MLTPIVLLWYILTEVGSIIENCGRLGAPMPKWFKARVDQYKEASDKLQEGGEPETEIGEEKVE